MKTGLIGINSQFIHSSLALYYLRAELPDFCSGFLREYNTNQPVLDTYYDIIKEDGELLAFPCYIWNREYVSKLMALIKESYPHVIIVAGGPEATYNPEAFPHADYICRGALEPGWRDFLINLKQGRAVDAIPGFDGSVAHADSWCFPYNEDDIAGLQHKLVYYETSRGCPYGCAFCLCSADKFTAFKPIKEVKKELQWFLEHSDNNNFPIIKLVDRTFNYPAERGREIIKFLLDNYRPGITFHFEIKGEILDEETVALLNSAPEGLFQIEIGIQSLNAEALAASARHSLWFKQKPLYRAIINKGNIHTHFDLIAGLPGEDMSSFAAGFSELITVHPHYLQVGFLKLLPGTGLCAQREKHGYVAEAFPPYEVIKSNLMSPSDFALLKKLDAFMDRIYNKGLMKRSLRFLIDKGIKGFDLCLELASGNPEEVLQEIYPLKDNAWTDLLRFDRALAGAGIRYSEEEERLKNSLCRDDAFRSRYLGHYDNLSSGEVSKRVALIKLRCRVNPDFRGLYDDIGDGESLILIDFKAKGRHKTGGINPDCILIDKDLINK